MKKRNDFAYLAWICAGAKQVFKILFCLVFCCLLTQIKSNAASATIYKSVASVLSLPYNVAARGGLVTLRGTVTLSNQWGLVIHDSTGGIWVDPESLPRNYTPGDQVVVVGTVGPGQYSPRIANPHIQLIGHGPLPAAKTVSFRQLSSGEEDVQYVSIEGTVRTVSPQNAIGEPGGITVSIAMPGGRVDAIFSPQLKAIASKLIDAKVRITATALCRKNDNMQATGVVLIVSDPSQIAILRAGPVDLFGSPIVQIGNLMRFRSATDYYHRVRLRGTLTFYEPGVRLILQSNTGAIEVFSTDTAPLQIGDLVEVVGFPAPDATGPILQDAVVRRLGHGAPVIPVPLGLQTMLSSKYRFCLIAIEMHLLRVIDEPTRTLLLLEQGHQVISAEIESGASTPHRYLVPGSTVKVSGINVLTGETGLIYGNQIHSHLLLRTIGDAVLIAPASWWTTTRLIYLIAVLAAITLGILVLLLNAQLKRWKMETVLEEREHLARDIHDTLAQSFAGIGFQLQVIRRSVAKNDPKSLQYIDIARELVQYSHREARRNLTPAADANIVHADLCSSLNACAQGLAKASEIEIELHSSQMHYSLPLRINEQLFHIGQEAIANAVRHGHPSHLSITIDYCTDAVRLEVSDNGCGFTLRGDLLGFGIRGMRKRASDIGGQLDIESSPGQGTRILVIVPITRNRILSYLLAVYGYLKKLVEVEKHAGN